MVCWGGNYYGQLNVPAGLVLKLPQTITFTSTPPNPGLVGSYYSPTTVGGASGNPVTFTSLTPAVCVMSGSTTAKLVGPGQCTIAANQVGDASYIDAPQATQTFTVSWFPFPTK